MKYIFFLLLLPTICHSQHTDLQSIFPVKDGKVYYEKTIGIEATKADVLKSRAKAWMASQTWTQPNIQEVDNTDYALLTANADQVLVFMIPMSGKGEIKSQMSYLYSVKVSVKDNKAKIEVDNVKLAGPTPNSYFPIEEFKSSMQSIYKGFSKRTMEKFYKSLEENYRELDKVIDGKILALETELVKGAQF